MKGTALRLASGGEDQKLFSAWLVRRVAELTGNRQYANFDSGGGAPLPALPSGAVNP